MDARRRTDCLHPCPPDDYRETIINGVIYAKADSQLVTVTLKNIPDSSSA